MSTFTWIDHSEKQRRQMLEAVDLFREKDTRDELGVSGIRDTFSDMLFPGTGALQTRARYFFFIPWIYRRMEADRVSSSEVARKLRAAEISLIDRLAENKGNEEQRGIIGISARQNLQRMPSSIYWNGMKLLKLCLFQGSQAEYQRSLDRTYAAGGPVKNDDGEVISGGAASWHRGLPPAPRGFPEAASLALTKTEAGYLSRRIIETHQDSLFAYLLDQGYTDDDAGFAWAHEGLGQVPAQLRRQVDHSQCFSEVMNGAAILYNLYLGEKEPRRDAVIANCETLYAEWSEMMNARRSAMQVWNRVDFWSLLREEEYVPSIQTHAFVDAWCERAIRMDSRALRESAETQSLIFDREKAIKKSLARCLDNSPNRALWKGDAGLGQMDFRWSSARVILDDIVAGLGGADA